MASGSKRLIVDQTPVTNWVKYTRGLSKCIHRASLLRHTILNKVEKDKREGSRTVPIFKSFEEEKNVDAGFFLIRS